MSRLGQVSSGSCETIKCGGTHTDGHLMEMAKAPSRLPRILVIEDEPIASALVTRILDQRGYEVVSVADGASGISAADAERPEVVILDLNLPDMHGSEVCRAIRRETDAPILILSSDMEAIAEAERLDIGADGYATKPFVPRELLARITALVGDEPLPADLAAPVSDIEVIGDDDIVIDLTEESFDSPSRTTVLDPNRRRALAVFAAVLIGLTIALTIWAFSLGSESTDLPPTEEVIIDTGVVVSEDGETEISGRTVVNTEIGDE